MRTDKTIEGPYPRWQRVMFAGGVITEDTGSVTVVDHGWMIVRKGDEEAHHAPPPLPITTKDLPAERTTSLLTKSLDAAWVQFDEITVESTRHIPAGGREGGDLPRTEIIFSDEAGGKSVAWLYQASARDLRESQSMKLLRGFVHAEQPGMYVLLSDKDEDLILE